MSVNENFSVHRMRPAVIFAVHVFKSLLVYKSIIRLPRAVHCDIWF